MNENPNYYAIIPANVRYADITPNAKLLYGEITALSSKTGICYANNDYFAKLYNVSKVSVSKWIKELVKNDFITSEIIYKEGTKEILNRYIRIVVYPIKEIFNTPIKEKFKDNNTSNNNTSNNNTSNNNITPLYPPLKEDEDFEQFWKHYPKQRIGNKQKALQAWNRVLREKRATAEQMIQACRNYAESYEVLRGYAKGCAAWLNDDRFTQWEKEEDIPL